MFGQDVDYIVVLASRQKLAVDQPTHVLPLVIALHHDFPLHSAVQGNTRVRAKAAGALVDLKQWVREHLLCKHFWNHKTS